MINQEINEITKDKSRNHISFFIKGSQSLLVYFSFQCNIYCDSGAVRSVSPLYPAFEDPQTARGMKGVLQSSFVIFGNRYIPFCGASGELFMCSIGACRN